MQAQPIVVLFLLLLVMLFIVLKTSVNYQKLETLSERTIKPITRSPVNESHKYFLEVASLTLGKMTS